LHEIPSKPVDSQRLTEVCLRSSVKPGIYFMALLFGVACPALAQSVAQPKTWTVTPFLGSSMGVGNPADDDSLAIGVAVGYDLTSNLGFEGELGYLFDVAGDTDIVDWSITNVSGNAIYHFDVPRVTPYATFGIGFEHSSIDVKDPDPFILVIPSSTEVSFNFGGGVKYPVTPRLLLRGDLRRFQANDLAPDFWRLYGGVTFRIGR
jgi:opacity protein-like surface antigen